MKWRRYFLDRTVVAWVDNMIKARNSEKFQLVDNMIKASVLASPRNANWMKLATHLLFASFALAGGPATTTTYPIKKDKTLKRDSTTVLAIDSYNNITSAVERCLRFSSSNSNSELVPCPTTIDNSFLFTITPFSASTPQKLTIKSFPDKSFPDGKCNYIISMITNSLYKRSGFHKQLGNGRV